MRWYWRHNEKAIQIIESRQLTNNYQELLINYKKIKKQLVDKYLVSNDKIAFVDMTATPKFFIKITDFTTVYKRLLLRELEKIFINEESI